MKKHITDGKTGLSYTLVGDYYIPNLTLPDETNYPIGRFGRMHLKFIKQHKRLFYVSLLTSGTLPRYLHNIDKDANERFDALVTAYAKANGIDERLKASDQMRWVGLMNNYRHCAEEVVVGELLMDVGTQ